MNVKVEKIENLAEVLTKLEKEGATLHLSTVHEEHDNHPGGKVTVNEAVGYIEKMLTIYAKKPDGSGYRIRKNTRSPGVTVQSY